MAIRDDSPKGPSCCPSNRAWHRECLIVIGILAFATSLFYYEVIFLGRTFLSTHLPGVMGLNPPYGYTGTLRQENFRIDGGASSWAIEPWSRKIGNEFASGRFPLWNEHQGFGAPLLANAQSGVLDPLRLPVVISGSPFAWDFYYLSRVIFGLLATYLFARSVGLAFAARVFFAIAYIFSGHFLILGNNHWIEAYFLLPLTLLGTELAIGRKPHQGFALIAVTVALNMFVGMPEVTLLVLLVAAAYGAYRLLQLARGETAQESLKRASFVIGAWLTGIALAAPLLVTLFEFVAHSSKIVSDRDVLGLYYEPLNRFIIWFIPHLNGRPLDPDAVNFINTYVGATVLMLGFYGFYPTRTGIYARLVPFSAFVAALLLAKTFGVPGINELGRLPGLNITYITKWGSPLTAFLLVLIASVGVHRLITEKPQPRLASSALVVFVWLALVGILSNWGALIKAPASRMWETVGMALLFASGVWIVVQVARLVPPKLVGAFCCILVTLELLVYAPRDVYQDRYDRYVQAPYVTFLKSQQANGPFRIFAFDTIMFADTSTIFGIDDIRTLDALYIDRYQSYIHNLVTTLSSPWPYSGFPPSWGEKETNPLSNRWFDLAGVKYVIRSSPSAAPPPDVDLIAQILKANKDHLTPPVVSQQTFTIGGVTKQVLFQHPPTTLQYPLDVRSSGAVLRFSLAMSSDVWDPSKGDGVAFEVAVESGGPREVLYRREIDPKNDPSHRRWVEDSIDLSRFIGKDVVLTLTTDPLGNSGSDWAGWGEIRLSPISADSPDQYPGDRRSQYSLVYNDEVQIFENLDVLPRAFLVGNVVPVADMNAAIATMKGSNIDPARVAVVEGLPQGEIKNLGPGAGTVLIRDRASTYVDIDVEANAQSLLVLTDAFYPGWTATVDGREVPIFPANLAFRGVLVPEGKHRVQFIYRPPSFFLGIGISLLALAALIVVSLKLDVRILDRRLRSFHTQKADTG